MAPFLVPRPIIAFYKKNKFSWRLVVSMLIKAINHTGKSLVFQESMRRVLIRTEAKEKVQGGSLQEKRWCAHT